MLYQHLSYVERLTIADGQRRGLSTRAIARMLGRDPGTINRELGRNVSPFCDGYNPCGAYFDDRRLMSR